MKKFRLLLIVASLLLLVCPFTACTSSDEPCDCEYCVEPTISLTAGEVTENSITFTLTPGATRHSRAPFRARRVPVKRWARRATG